MEIIFSRGGAGQALTLLLTLYSSSKMDNIPDLLLYHYDEVHYDLLLPRDTPLALHGNVPSRLAKIQTSSFV